MLTTKENKQLKLFLIITFVVTMGMGVLVGIAHNKGIDTSNFIGTQMFYPAAAVMLTVLITNKGDSNIPKKFYFCFLILTLILMILNITSIFVNTKFINANYQLVMIVGTIICWICYFLDGKKRRLAYGLKFKELLGVLYLFLFFILYALYFVLNTLISGEFSEFVSELRKLNILGNFLMILPGVILSFTPFFGEEYGWRYLLQSLMQKKFGNYKGIILAGIIWGVWHLPANMFLYSPETSFLSLMNQLIVCVFYGIFLGMVYMKTNNIWLPVLIHYFNNNLIFVLSGSSNIGGQVLTWKMIAMQFISFAIVYGLFILSKEYKKKHDNLGILYKLEGFEE